MTVIAISGIGSVHGGQREAALRDRAMTDGMMIMSGLWAKWKDPKIRRRVLSCTFLTCAPNEIMPNCTIECR
jgi:putative SOS response-associated peptidase YedK